MGGTISSIASPAGGVGVTPALMGDQIVESVPEIGEFAEVDTGDFATIPSFEVTIADMHALAGAALQGLEEGCDGVVITHGTDTIEETAYALALMVPRGRTMVLTGAMRNPTLPGNDGPANLLAAFLAATSPDVEELGTVLVLNDEIHTARWGTKLHSTLVSTFSSIAAGPVGEVIEEQVHVWFRPAWDDYLGYPESIDDLKVEFVRIVADPGDSLIKSVVAAEPSGIVLEGTGGGHVPSPMLPALDAAIAGGIPVVVCKRPTGGRTLERTYGMPGGEIDLIDRGALRGGALPGHKARLRLLIGLALGFDPASLFPV